MLTVLGLWSHALAALLFGALAIWQLRHWNGDPRNRPLVAAFAVTAVWAIFLALLGSHHWLADMAESARNFAFLAFMYGIVRSAADNERLRAVRLVYFTVAAVIGLQIVVAGVLPRFDDEPAVRNALETTAHIIGLTIAAGSLVLVHNLYGQAAPDARWGIRLPMIALAGLWAYDLHLYTVAYLSRAPVDDLLAMRGAIAAMLVPLFALASRRNAQWRMRMSRAATFQSLSVLAILAYLILMMSATQAIEVIGGNWTRVGQIALIFVMSVVTLILLPSGKARAWLRVMLAKHFFEHRYDYREEWLRFTRTVGRSGGDVAPLGDRVIKALADISDSPAGLLLVTDDQNRLVPAARWNWHHEIGRSGASDHGFIRFLEATAHIVDFETTRDGRLIAGEERVAVPAWLAEIETAWAGIPLLHNDRLVGLVILAHPLVRRPLDWEDFDLFRAAGIQAASYLAEARSQEALATSQRFDEFNRRFAFILHDIKNLVSQLSLVARNAERHADNPEFRADMIATLRNSVTKMNDLLARLTRDGRTEPASVRETKLHPILSAIAGAKQGLHAVHLFGDPALTARADPARLEQAVGHLVQNAIDASPPGEAVRICYGARGSELAIEVIDSGAGMSAEFVGGRLFQPFASTKEGGFGIGAFEARTLVAAMGGRIEVESREGEGSRFTIFLPACRPEAVRPFKPEHERKRA
ncbi:XrtA/PEP-CTERM system histidine kinase PrsK [Sphingosinicella humi]|uniref:histidine kinase n=1 Tax=Allosphingosinicella humi TaxID=2068657 RepID=A0A2U2J359_9SPHN|nr:XrtA/PEP-CTERM system histidine kinase PrsK [Sphingosinicella humi]PWG02767.1 PEP-CTERM system histidine kinase PrsK [Sphingosinicella humi]